MYMYKCLKITLALLLSQFLPQPVNAQSHNAYTAILEQIFTAYKSTGATIGVAGFSYSDGRDSRDGGVVSERLTTELVKSNRFKVIERKEIERVFEELKLQLSGAVNIKTVQETGKLLGGDILIVGTITDLPDQHVEINARLVEIGSGEIVGAASERTPKDWLDTYRAILKAQNMGIEKDPKETKALYSRGLI
jgi:curli biogenesis system outer membrane secretion channel CsgG